MHQHDITLRADCDDEHAVLFLSFVPPPPPGALLRRRPLLAARTVRVSPHVTADLAPDDTLLGLELHGPARDALLKAGLVAEERATAQLTLPPPDLYEPLTWTQLDDGAWQSDREGYTLLDMSNGEVMLHHATFSAICVDRHEAQARADLDCWLRGPRRRLL
jgi:hypothetical protein